MNLNTDTDVKTSLNVSNTTATNIVGMGNCGLAVLNVNGNNKNAFANKQYGNKNDAGNDLICAACKPGYKSDILADTKSLMKHNCTEISQCELTSTNNKIFDGCGQCK